MTVRDAAEALLDNRGTGRAFVVLGDLNDEPQAATTQILLGPPGSELETAGFDRPDKRDAMRLSQAGQAVLRDGRVLEPGLFIGRPCDLPGCAASAYRSMSFAHRFSPSRGR